MNKITAIEKLQAKNFLIELNNLFNKYDLVIDCHCDFVSLLCSKTIKDGRRKLIATLYEDCEPEYNE